MRYRRKGLLGGKKVGKEGDILLFGCPLFHLSYLWSGVARLEDAKSKLVEERSASMGEAIMNEEDTIRLNSRYAVVI